MRRGTNSASAWVRAAAAADAPAIAAIYAPHVLKGTATFEEVVPGNDEMAQRIRRILDAGYPWLVAGVGDEIAGYAYAGPYHPRSAYRFTVEDSVYLAERFQGRGIGRLLLATLLDACRQRGYRQVMSLIGDSANEASIALHERLGFTHIGLARAIGHKFGRDLDVVYMQLTLAPS
jgi:L-amino acid N-acyltransferase YncA